MDNRLRVERDELQHAAKEKESRRRQRQTAFDDKVAKMRRRSLGVSEDEDKEASSSQNAKGTVAAPPVQKDKAASDKRRNDDDYGKYGVTVSNLKHAEAHLDQSLKWRKDCKRPDEDAAPGRGYWCNEGLGSGPHINLFEGAELEVQKQAASHGKLLRYADTNNELAGKSKKAPLSEFDAVGFEKPWYLQSSSSSSSSGQQGNAAEDVPPAELKNIWKEKHGQRVLRVKVTKNPAVKREEVEEKTKDEEDEESKERKRRVKKEEKTQKKQDKEERKRAEKDARRTCKEEQKRSQREVLRQGRLQREQQERTRSFEMVRMHEAVLLR